MLEENRAEGGVAADFNGVKAFLPRARKTHCEQFVHSHRVRGIFIETTKSH